MPDRISEIRQLIKTDINAARKAVMPILKGIEAKGSDEEKAEIFHLTGLIEFYDGKSADAIKWYTKELRLRQKIKDIKGLSDVLNNIGVIYYNKGQLGKAIDYYRKALSHREIINDLKGIAGASENIGVVLFRTGLSVEAFNMYHRALEINRNLGDSDRIGMSLQNIGLTYLSQSDYTNALTNFQEALTIARNNKDKVRSIQLLINIGNTLLEQKNIAEAKKYYEKCYKESKSNSYQQGLLVSLKNLSHIAQIQGKYKESIRYYTDSIEIAKATDHIAEITTSLSGIGMAYAALNDNEKALKYLREALSLAKKIGVKQNIEHIYLNFSEIYEKLGNYKKAFEYYKKYIAVRDELVNKETTKTINEIKTRYEVEKKEKEAQLLKEKNEAISIYARKLEASNNSLNQFAHIASHDLREPLRMVSSYLGLLERTMGDQITPTQKQFIDFAVDGSKRMDNLIQDLLRLARVDADPRIERVSLTEVVDVARHNLQVLLKEKNARIKATDLPTIMADRTQVMQLLQNIIGNGIKYNESAQPTVTISYQKGSSESVISIADNGIGIAPEYREKAFQIFQRVPTAKKYQGSGIGLAICKKIVDGLNGSISIADNPGGGTVFQISIPTSLIS